MSSITILTKNTGQPRTTVSTAAELYQLLSSGTQAAALIIAAKELDTCKPIIYELRTNRKTALLPIFIHPESKIEGVETVLSDGIITSLSEIEESAAAINSKLSETETIHLTADSDRTCMLLSWLYSRQNSELKPYKRWSSKQIYSYPLAETVANETEQSLQWVESLHERGLLQQQKLIDRIRHCPHCNSSHLNFIDTCPQCQSINIAQQPFLHCFTCGHVGFEDNFIAAEGLSCPNCRAKMRHIGVDYDRALENFLCGDCNSSFIDPLILVRCQECDSINEPENLAAHNIYTYQLTEQGAAAARSGSLGEIYAMLDRLNNVNPIFFNHWLDWLLALNRRYPEEGFSIIGIYLANLSKMVEILGSRRVWEIMDEFISRIRSLIRSTDITSQNSRQGLWLLLPKTDSSGCAILLERILEIQKLTKQPEGIGLEFSTVTFTAPEETQEKESAKLLLARLRSEVRSPANTEQLY